MFSRGSDSHDTRPPLRSKEAYARRRRARVERSLMAFVRKMLWYWKQGARVDSASKMARRDRMWIVAPHDGWLLHARDIVTRIARSRRGDR